MISIAMATYNGEKYIGQQLESIAKQTVLPDELVVCDDCSNDNTVSVLQRFKETAPFNVIIIGNSENGGYIKNFAKVIQAAKGDYVFMCDQDDYWFPNKIETVLKTFDENPNFQLVAHNAMCTDASLKPTGTTLFEYDALRGLRYGSAIHGFVTCAKRSYLELALPIPYCYSFDRWLSLPASELGLRYELDQTLGYYRRHDSAITYDVIGRNCSLLDLAKIKIRNNLKSLARVRSMEEFDYRYTRETSIVEFAQKMQKKYNGVPDWCDQNLLNKMVEKANTKIEAFKVRRNAIENKGIKRLKLVYAAYAKGVYKNFHGIQTALDDLFRR